MQQITFQVVRLFPMHVYCATEMLIISLQRKETFCNLFYEANYNIKYGGQDNVATPIGMYYGLRVLLKHHLLI